MAPTQNWYSTTKVMLLQKAGLNWFLGDIWQLSINFETSMNQKILLLQDASCSILLSSDIFCLHFTSACFFLCHVFWDYGKRSVTKTFCFKLTGNFDNISGNNFLGTEFLYALLVSTDNFAHFGFIFLEGFNGRFSITLLKLKKKNSLLF